jgi:hypothetical protein
VTEVSHSTIMSDAVGLEHGVKLAVSADRQAGKAMLTDSVVTGLLGEAALLGEKTPEPRRTTVYGADPGMQALLTRTHVAAVEGERLIFASPPPDAITNDCLSGDGRAVFCATVMVADALVICMPPCSPKATVSLEAVSLFAAAAKARARTVVMLFIGLAEQVTSQLSYVFDDVIVANGCEPDHGHSSAYILRPAPGSVSEAIGWKPVVVNSNLMADFSIVRVFGRGASTNFATREIIRLADSGKSYSTIGKALGLHKSTVKRRLDAMPFNPKRKLLSQEED